MVRAFVLRYWVSDPEGIHLIYPESRQLPGGVAEVDSGYMYTVSAIKWPQRALVNNSKTIGESDTIFSGRSIKSS